MVGMANPMLASSGSGYMKQDTGSSNSSVAGAGVVAGVGAILRREQQRANETSR